MAKSKEEKTLELVEYLELWASSQASYFKWIEEEYVRRLGRFKKTQQRGSHILAKQVSKLDYSDDGRVQDHTKVGDRRKQVFRKKTDKVMNAVVVKGRDQFGVRGSYDRAGIFIGKLDCKLRREALKRLTNSLQPLKKAAENA